MNSDALQIKDGDQVVEWITPRQPWTDPHVQFRIPPRLNLDRRQPLRSPQIGARHGPCD